MDILSISKVTNRPMAFIDKKAEKPELNYLNFLI